MKKLSVNGMAMAFGVIEGGAVLIAGIFNALFGWGDSIVGMLQQVYTGFTPTFDGILVGTFWAFIVGFVVGAVLAWTYNSFSER